MTGHARGRWRAVLRWIRRVAGYRIVQADDPVGLMFRHPDDDPRE